MNWPIKSLGQPLRFVRYLGLDFLVGEELVVELKAVETVHPIHPAKVINYLKISGLELGLIINFHVIQLRDGIKRIVLT